MCGREVTDSLFYILLICIFNKNGDYSHYKCSLKFNSAISLNCHRIATNACLVGRRIFNVTSSNFFMSI